MKWLSIILIALCCLGCSDDDNKSWILPPNGVLNIGFSDTLVFNSKYPLEQLNKSPSVSEESLVYYKKDGNKIYIPSGVFKTGGINIPFEHPYYSLSISNSINMLSANNGIKSFYIDWPNAQTDTLLADYRSDPKGPNNCTCSEPLVELTLNGKTFIEKTDYSINGVYVFE